MFDGSKHKTMEMLESAAYVALRFIPTLALLEIAYRLGMKIKRKGSVVGRDILPPSKSLLPIVLRTRIECIHQQYPSENISANRS